MGLIYLLLMVYIMCALTAVIITPSPMQGPSTASTLGKGREVKGEDCQGGVDRGRGRGQGEGAEWRGQGSLGLEK